jgi:hypothetical protein
MVFDVASIRGRKRLDEVVGDSRSDAENGSLSVEQRMLVVKTRQNLVLWRSPVRTLYYFILELSVQLHHSKTKYGCNAFLSLSRVHRLQLNLKVKHQDTGFRGYE